MMKPIVIVNFKNYKKATGNGALKIAKRINLLRSAKYDVIMAPSLLSTKEIAEKTNLKVFSQHCGPYGFGAHTGHVSADELRTIGVQGVILNHSENKFLFPILTTVIDYCNKKRLTTVVCTSSLAEAKKIASLKPNFIAYEPQELIGGNISVTEANPDIIVKAVELVKSITRKTKVLVGAGVHQESDLGHALMLGAHGVLLSHKVVEAKDPMEFLKEMLL